MVNSTVSCATNQGGALFYETGIDNFGFLSDIYKVFDGE